MICLALSLVFLNLFALASIQLSRRWRPAALGLVLAAYGMFIDRSWWQIPWAVDGWRTGEARLLAAGLVAGIPGTDPETRLHWTQSCMATDREAWVRNTTLTLLHRYIGPATGTWQGTIPSEPEARRILASQGYDLEIELDRPLLDRFSWIRGQSEQPRVSISRMGTSPGCGDTAVSTLEIRVAPLDDDTILVGCGDSVAVYLKGYDDTYREFLPAGARHTVGAAE